jgi:putative ATP-dependent endonuclease of OLD family
MYLKLLSIENFRSIEKLTLNFRKGVNIIIGENNAGKTAIIDALRICLSYGSLSREICIKKDEDFYIDCNNPASDCSEIRFDLLFEVESSIERAIFTDFIKQDKDDPIKQTIELHFKYFLETKNDNKVLRWRVWGGENEGQPVPVEALQLISHTYLGALRNASEKLRPHSYDNKIAKLFKNLKHFKNSSDQKTSLDLKKRNELAKNIQDSIQAGDWNKVIATGNQKVLEHITHSAINGKEPNIEFSFLPYTYEGIVDNIQARKPIFDLNGNAGIIEQRYFRVSQNGLGENNLIYAGTVLGDLISQNDTDDKDIYYNALLIEEPEAHLHPQKQNTFFQYLSSLENSDVQIFMTSHSPTITAKSNLDFITILQRQGNRISAFSINNSELDETNKVYLSKFLDVTKSQLFFANGTILVEGISEALLLHVFSKMIDEDIDKNGVEVVNLNGVAFEHFAKLFNSENEKKRLLARCTLLTDDDNGQITDSAFNFINKKKTSLIFKKLKESNIIDASGLIQSVDISAIDFGDDIDESFVSVILELIKHRKTTDSNCGKVETNEKEILDVSKEMTKERFKYLQENGVIDKLNRIRSIDLTSLIFETEGLKNHIERILTKLNGKFSARALKAKEYSTGNLQTKLAEVTFEYALMIEDEKNYRIIKRIYQEMHPDTDLLVNSEPLKDRAMNLLLKLYSNKDKSELAHRLAVCLESHEKVRNHFKVPCYIEEGIKWVTKGTN